MNRFILWKKQPKPLPVLRFKGGEILRLKKDYPGDDLKVGDYGIVWAAYNTTPPFYEASFLGIDGNTPDISFMDDEIDDSVDVIDVQEISSVVAKEYFLNWLNKNNNINELTF